MNKTRQQARTFSKRSMNESSVCGTLCLWCFGLSRCDGTLMTGLSFWETGNVSYRQDCLFTGHGKPYYRITQLQLFAAGLRPYVSKHWSESHAPWEWFICFAFYPCRNPGLEVGRRKHNRTAVQKSFKFIDIFLHVEQWKHWLPEINSSSSSS